MSFCGTAEALTEATDAGTLEVFLMVLEDEEGADPAFAAKALTELTGVTVVPGNVHEHRAKKCSCFPEAA